MASIFEFTDYRLFIREHFASLPKAGYGQARKLAGALNIHSTLVSQVLQGIKSFTLEQAAEASRFLSLTEMETDYFLILVQMDRAGSPYLKRQLSRQIESLQKRSKELSNRLTATAKLSEEQRAVFYSSWTYAAVRQLTAIEGFQTIDSIGSRLGLSRKALHEIVDFLVASGLCKKRSPVSESVLQVRTLNQNRNGYAYII